MKYLINILILLSLNISLNAQKNDASIIVMNSGSILKGKIIEWSGSDSLVLISDGILDRVVLKQSEIQKIFPSGRMQEELLNPEAQSLNIIANSSRYNFISKGPYATAKAQFITANDGDRAQGVNGYGISVSAGYRFSRLLAIGAGIGYDQFIWNSGEEMIPLFLEVNGFFTPTSTSLFYNLQSGYSIALSDDTYLIEDAQGGLMIYPAVGVRFGSARNKITLDFGYKFQNATYTYRDVWVATTEREQKLTYKRMALRLGVLF